MSINDTNLVLRVIQTGNFPQLVNLKINLDQFTKEKLVSEFQSSDTLKYNYYLAKNIANLLLIEEGKLKKSLQQLVALELNQYQDSKMKRNKIYRQIDSLASSLVAFPEKKRIIKFLVKFTKTSKALQSTVKEGKNFIIFKIYHNINLGVK